MGAGTMKIKIDKIEIEFTSPMYWSLATLVVLVFAISAYFKWPMDIGGGHFWPSIATRTVPPAEATPEKPKEREKDTDIANDDPLPRWGPVPSVWPPVTLPATPQSNQTQIADSKQGKKRKAKPRYYWGEEIFQGDQPDYGFERRIIRRTCVPAFDWPLICSMPKENRDSTIIHLWQQHFQ